MLKIEIENQELEAFYNTTYQDNRQANEKRWKDFKKSEYERTYQKEKAIWQTYNTILQKELSEARDGENDTSCPFKDYLLNKFELEQQKYAIAPLANWLNQDVEAKRKEILSTPRHNNNYDHKLIHETDHKVILKFIAEYKAKDEVHGELYAAVYGDNFIYSDREIIIKEESAKSTKNGFTTARQVIAIMLLNEAKKISYSQDHINIEKLIEFLTGKTPRNIKKYRQQYSDGNGILHKSSKKNKEDYEFVRNFFENLELQEVVKIIDQRLKKINTLNDK